MQIKAKANEEQLKKKNSKKKISVKKQYWIEKHFNSNKTAGIFEVNDIVRGQIGGCTKIATQFSLRNDTYKWLVCEYCSQRGLYALNEYLSCLGYRYDLATNEKLR